jgi:phosphoglycerate dehydrogenase-like enzyme
VITLMYSNYVPSAGHVRRLEEIAGDGRVAVALTEADALAHAGSTEIVLGHRYLRQLLPHAPGLRWVQTTAAGFDQLPVRELHQRAITLTRNPQNARSISHHALALAWALLRRLPLAMRAQSTGEWAASFPMLPLPRTALVLGLGAIGAQVAVLLRGTGLYVRGTDKAGTSTQRQACDEFVDAGHWRDALAHTDILVLALPLDESTRQTIGERELARLPRHAIVVNVARAGLVDQPALVAALRTGRIGGAALDVLEPVPAADDPLWTTPNLLITPKVAAYHPGMQADFEAFAEVQTRRFLSGAPLEAIVTPSAESPR